MELIASDFSDYETDLKYDLVYCLRSSWYFREAKFLDAIAKMIDMTKDGGYIVFDVMNRRTWLYYKTIIKRLIFVYGIQTARWIIKRRFKVGPPNYMFHIGRIDKFLDSQRIMYRKMTEGQACKDTSIDGKKTAKVLYICRKS